MLLTEVEAPDTEQVRAFDRQVLLRPAERRRTRELVKGRIRKGDFLGLANATLLLVARGGSPNDQEWALEGLARRWLVGLGDEALVVENPVERI